MRTNVFVAGVVVAEALPKELWRGIIGIPCNPNDHMIAEEYIDANKELLGERLTPEWGTLNSARTHRFKSAKQPYATEAFAEQGMVIQAKSALSRPQRMDKDSFVLYLDL